MSMNAFHARTVRPKSRTTARPAVERHGGMRLDALLVERGLAPSRSAAQRLIAAGCVKVSPGETALLKPAQVLPRDTALVVLPDDSL
jgi:23S rRNA (cytidine1920-2'-O)/16S rRNA (cytidine1409-2'-O)-methyltransferase